MQRNGVFALPFPDMRFRFTLALVLSLSLFPFRGRAEDEIGFVETFVFAQDREAVLEQLVPGTDNYYLFHALHYQNTGQKNKLATTMEAWARRIPDSGNRKVIERRQALIGYDSDPRQTLKFLKDELHLEFNHTQQVRDKRPDLPASLDNTNVASLVFLSAALAEDNLDGLSQLALENLVRNGVKLRPAQLRSLLSHLERPNIPGLVERIVQDLQSKESQGFGEWPIHRNLLPEQLDQLAQLYPEVRSRSSYVFARLRKLAPNADEDAASDPAVREAWLDRLATAVRELPASFNSLKAQVFYSKLQLDRSRGIYDRNRFVEYIRLPRTAAYVSPAFLEHQDMGRTGVNLNADYGSERLGLPSIGNDEPLVRDYFLHFAVSDAEWEPWTEWLRDTWVKPLFAEAKITAGVGDPEKWASLLTPSAYQALRERVDIEFPATNPAYLDPESDIALEVTLKQTPKLIVKIFELNTLSFALAQKRQPNTDLNLDGLVANSEQTYDITESPFRRITRTFKFPELKDRRGAWVIEFIGGGKSSRALLRKGQYSLLQQVGPAGDVLIVLDEKRQPATNTVAWLDGRKWSPAGTNGQILIPFSEKSGQVPIVLANADGTFATLTQFHQHQEEYTLHVDFHIDREQLLAGRDATVAVRTSLLLDQTLLTPELLLEPRLTLTTVTLDGISTISEIPMAQLHAGQVYTHSFRVPERLASVSATVSGKIDLLSRGGEKRHLTASHNWEVNGMDKSDATFSGHLSRFGDHYVFELLGKNGEPIADQQVVFEFHHADFSHVQSIPLRSNEKGQIDLGPLPQLIQVTSKLTNGRELNWELIEFSRKWPGTIHTTPDAPVQLPWSGPLETNTVSLLEIRQGEFVRDLSSRVKPVGAFLEIFGLQPGDYELRLHGDGDPQITLRVSQGNQVGRWIVARNRVLEIRDVAYLQIESATVETNQVTVQLRNWDPFTRVHVVATRFLPPISVIAGLGDLPSFNPGLRGVDRFPNLYAGGREVGDEYRYILDRRYATKFPGNLLERPSLLLNPWERRETEQNTVNGRAGVAPTSMAGLPDVALNNVLGSMIRPGDSGRGNLADNANIDFLRAASPALYNLAPDSNGRVTIPKASLRDRQFVQLYVENLSQAVWGTLDVPTRPTALVDRRLSHPLDPSKTFAQKKSVSLLRTGESLEIRDILTSDLETYDSLASVHNLLTSLSHNPTLATFDWLLRWPNLKDEEKRAKYSEFACHELNFFLNRKDPEFFGRVIRPYLKNKLHKTFLDDYLLENPLIGYLEPWTFSRLNAAEQALLARRLPEKSQTLQRHLRELWENLPSNPESEVRLFDTALRGRALEVTGAMTNSFGLRDIAGLSTVDSKDALAPSQSMPELALAEPRFEGKRAMTRFASERKSVATDRNELMLMKEEPQMFSYEVAREVRRDARSLAYYRQVGVTKEWAENNYYQLRLDEQGPELISINRFWLDLATWDGKTPFLSTHLAEASRNFPEIMLALAVLDLPWESPRHTHSTDGSTFTLVAAGPLIAFHQQFEAVQASEPNGGTALLVSENFYRNGDRYRVVGNERSDNYVTGEFLSGVVYGASVVLSNPGSAPAKLDLLTQIPQGAIPVASSKATQSRFLRLEPYTTHQLDYYFYFPEPSTQSTGYPHFPVNLTVAGHHVGAARSQSFQVVRQLSTLDTGSWEHVSQYGTEDDVFTYLESHNLQRIDFEKVAWRARKSVSFFRKLVAFLEAHQIWSEPVYQYAVVHNETPALRTWLRHRDDFLAGCGPALDCPLITIDPVERHGYEHLEFSPLINQRVHRFGATQRIANQGLSGQYHSFLLGQAFLPRLSPEAQLEIVYYLMVQDRIEEALARFHTVQPESLSTRIQYDYLRCYADFFEEKLADARGLAHQYADYPVDRWRARFAEVAAQLDELDGKTVARNGSTTDREQQTSRQAASEPSFDFTVEKQALSLHWKNMKEVTIRYYRMDPEFLFSSSPFVSGDPDRFSIIQPTLSVRQVLPDQKDTLELPLPVQFSQANVLIEILGGGQRKAHAYHANTFKLAIAENFGRLEVRDLSNDKPVARAYVKVYARLQGGAIRFMKDGYTDLRGKFDYASVNGGSSNNLSTNAAGRPSASGGLDNRTLRPEEIGSIEKIAVLVLSDSHGAAVQEVNPPKS